MDFRDAVTKLCKDDARYPIAAYAFIRDALDHTVKTLDKPDDGPNRHVSGQELLDGIRTYALQDMGPVATTVFESWGIQKTEDFGNIVFNMVHAGLLGKTDSDTPKDFSDSYDFHTAFALPFLPSTPESDAQQKKAPRKRNRPPRADTPKDTSS